MKSMARHGATLLLHLGEDFGFAFGPLHERFNMAPQGLKDFTSRTLGSDYNLTH